MVVISRIGHSTNECIAYNEKSQLQVLLDEARTENEEGGSNDEVSGLIPSLSPSNHAVSFGFLSDRSPSGFRFLEPSLGSLIWFTSWVYQIPLNKELIEMIYYVICIKTENFHELSTNFALISHTLYSSSFSFTLSKTFSLLLSLLFLSSFLSYSVCELVEEQSALLPSSHPECEVPLPLCQVGSEERDHSNPEDEKEEEGAADEAAVPPMLKSHEEDSDDEGGACSVPPRLELEEEEEEV